MKERETEKYFENYYGDIVLLYIKVTARHLFERQLLYPGRTGKSIFHEENRIIKCTSGIAARVANASRSSS